MGLAIHKYTTNPKGLEGVALNTYRSPSSRMHAKSFLSVYIHTRQTSSVDDIAWQLSFPRLTEMLGFSAVPAGVSLPARPVTPSR